MSDPSVFIIILNWNGWSDTVECLESIYHINYPNYQIIVVDNNSSDDSIKKIIDYTLGKLEVKSNFFKYDPNDKPIETAIYSKEYSEIKKFSNPHEQLILLKNDLNYGFAEGNNIGIEFTLKNLNPDYILLLNNDTVVDKDFLGILVQEGEKDGKIGILGPKMYYYDDPNLIWCIGGKINWKLARGLHVGINEPDIGQYPEKMNFDYINGSALLIKRNVLDEIGLLDNKFFLYFEETDLALRASKKNYTRVYVPKSKIWHKVSKSGGGIKKEIGLYYITRNRWIFMRKWAKKSDFIIFVVIQILGVIMLPILLSIYYNNRKLFSAYYSGFWHGLTEKNID
jgi:GT2 family glycosyltransferase